MPRRSWLVLALLMAPATVDAQVPAGWSGTWHLDVAKSTYRPGPPPYRRATYTIEAVDDRMKVTYDLVHPRGGTSHFEWTGKLDGKDYRVQGFDDLVTYAYSRLSDGSYHVFVRMDGRVAAQSTIILSPDGRTMTTSTVGVGAGGQKTVTITVYEKSRVESR